MTDVRRCEVLLILRYLLSDPNSVTKSFLNESENESFLRNNLQNKKKLS